MDRTMDTSLTKKPSDNLWVTGESVNINERKILRLGMHPYADTFIPREMTTKTEPILPLECSLNTVSGMVQLDYQSKETERYNLYPYSYTSANSEYSRDHWDEFFNDIPVEYYDGKKVMEIGSNDCYLLEKFTNSDKLAFDAATEMCKIASGKGIANINGVFNSQLALNSSQVIQSSYSLIIANNVLNHSNDPTDFIYTVSRLLTDDGVFVFEVPYWLDTIKSGRFDQIYHEHFSYFTVKSIYSLLTICDMFIDKITFNEYHGGSIRVFARKGTLEMSPNVAALIEREELEGLFTVERYEKFQKEIERNRSGFMAKLHTIRATEDNVYVVGIGAAAKANTLLNFYGIDNTIMDYVTDSSELKQGKYTPLTRIPIVSDKILSELPEDATVYVVILAWNIEHKLRPIIEKIRPDVKFLSIMEEEDGSN